MAAIFPLKFYPFSKTLSKWQGRHMADTSDISIQGNISLFSTCEVLLTDQSYLDILIESQSNHFHLKLFSILTIGFKRAILTYH